MGKNSRISWCHHSWNPWYGGCAPRGPECRECYAKRDMRRYGKDPDTLHVAMPRTFGSPTRWTEPARIFVCSWSDFFLDVPAVREVHAAAWSVMRHAPQHTYIIPTKRPENIWEMLPKDWDEGWLNVWLLVSAGTQESLDKWWPALRDLPAAVKGISIEPMLEPLCEELDAYVTKWSLHYRKVARLFAPNWIILGGESANSYITSRPFPIVDACRIVDMCQSVDLAVFVKQMGTRWAHETVVQNGKTAYQLGDRKGQRMEWWPEQLRVQEFPA